MNRAIELDQDRRTGNQPPTVNEVLLQFVRTCAGSGYINTRATARIVLRQIEELES